MPRNALILQDIGNSWRKGKRLYAHFVEEDGTGDVITHFGLRNGSTYIDHKNKELRDNYIARHSVRESHLWENQPMSAATLSLYILWGPHPSIRANIAYYKHLFNI